MSNLDQSSPTIVGPQRSARSWGSPKVRLGLIGAFAVIGILVVWRILVPAREIKAPKSQAQAEVEKIMVDNQKAGAAATTQVDDGSPDRPVGDTEAFAALNSMDAKEKIEARKKAETEEKMLASLAYQHYIRRSQGLKYDPMLAADWERRLQDAQAKGQPAPQPPADVTPENLEQIRTSHPELYAKWVAMHGERAGTGVAGPSGTSSGQVARSGQGSAPGAPGAAMAQAGIPAGIDPKTGLPVNAGVAGSPSDVVYALLDDGSPDLANGAIPITVQFDLPGSKEKIQKTVWIRPGYLTGRNRPVDPTELKAEDDAYRRSLKDPTDVPAEAVNNISIPYRYSNSKTRVPQATDFNFVNRYVVVLPNPNGKLTPPNPPVPSGTTGGRK